MNNPTFTPRPVGSIDSFRENQIKTLYQEICESASGLHAYLQQLFGEQEEVVTIDLINNLMTSDPEKKIRTLWVEVNSIASALPGVNMERFINSDLLDIPKYDEILSSIKELKELYFQSKVLRFYFPLTKLFNPDPDASTFSLSEEFNNVLRENGTVYTENQQQNELLAAIEAYKDSVNVLCNMGVMSPSSVVNKTAKLLYSALKRNPGSAQFPFEINPNIFRLSFMQDTVR